MVPIEDLFLPLCDRGLALEKVENFNTDISWIRAYQMVGQKCGWNNICPNCQWMADGTAIAPQIARPVEGFC